MSSGRKLRSGNATGPKKSPQKTSIIEPAKKRGGKGGQKGSGKTNTGSKAADAVNALHQAEEFITKSSAKETTSAKKGKREREDEDEVEMETAAHKQAAEWMLEDEYALEIEHRKEETLSSLAHYEQMSKAAKKSLKGKTLDKKLLEIKNKINNLGEKLVSYRTLSDKRYEEIYDDAVESLNKEKKPTKKRRIESEPSDGEELDVSDGKSPLPLEFRRLHSFSLSRTTRNPS
jgi:hypothetical protein